MPWEEFNKVKDEKVFQHQHTQSVSTESATTKDYIKNNFNVLATSEGKIRNKDYNHISIVSALQHKVQPWQGIQFHPEKSQFEISLKLQPNLINSKSIAKVGQAMADGFVDECRIDNTNRATDKQYADTVIYNNRLIFSKIL